MTDTVRERIYQALLAALETVEVDHLGVTVKVERNRDTEVTQLPSLVLIDRGQDVDSSSSGITDLLTRRKFGVSCC